MYVHDQKLIIPAIMVDKSCSLPAKERDLTVQECSFDLKACRRGVQWLRVSFLVHKGLIPAAKIEVFSMLTESPDLCSKCRSTSRTALTELTDPSQKISRSSAKQRSALLP